MNCCATADRIHGEIVSLAPEVSWMNCCATADRIHGEIVSLAPEVL